MMRIILICVTRSLLRSFLLPVSILSVIFCTHASVGMDVISYFGMILLALPGVREVSQRCHISNFPWCQVELSTSSLLVMFQAAITLGMILSPLVTARQVTLWSVVLVVLIVLVIFLVVLIVLVGLVVANFFFEKKRNFSAG